MSSNVLFETYADIKRQINALETQADALKEDVLQELRVRTIDMEDKNLKFVFGTFSVTSRKIWEYSEEIKARETDLKNLKKIEELKGIAKATITEGLRYTE